MSTCLQMDVGNSSAKWRLLEEGFIIARGRYVSSDVDSRSELLGSVEKLDQIWIASVAADAAESELRAVLVERWNVEPWFARTGATAGDLKNSYDDPSRMGVDRWLAMLGARARCRERICVVDAGSALTIDLVSPTGQHEGGYIMPGPELMERALLLDTDRVRFEEAVDYSLAPGTSTAEAVRHGIALAQAGGVAMALDRLGGEPARLFFCGGAGEPLMNLLGRGGEFVPDLVFEGLARSAELGR